MSTGYNRPRDIFRTKYDGASAERTRMGHPSGRLGGPWAPSRRRQDDHMLASATMESYSAVTPFKETLNRLRRALSRRGFEIMRECDLASRIRPQWRSNSGSCRMLYVTEPELFATAISRHASAALWLPIPVVLYEQEESVTILRPAEAIVRDRATVLGLRAMVEQSYKSLSQILEIVGTPSDPAPGPAPGPDALHRQPNPTPIQADSPEPASTEPRR